MRWFHHGPSRASRLPGRFRAAEKGFHLSASPFFLILNTARLGTVPGVDVPLRSRISWLYVHRAFHRFWILKFEHILGAGSAFHTISEILGIFPVQCPASLEPLQGNNPWHPRIGGAWPGSPVPGQTQMPVAELSSPGWPRNCRPLPDERSQLDEWVAIPIVHKTA